MFVKIRADTHTRQNLCMRDKLCAHIYRSFVHVCAHAHTFINFFGRILVFDELSYKIALRSELLLQRYLQNNTVFFNVFYIYPNSSEMDNY